ncbi:MAG: hypothetical protein ACOYLB_07690 [Phototrophicaceae bacterium]
MNIDMYLEISFDNVGLRDSQKRLKEIIKEVAIDPIEDFQELEGNFESAEQIVSQRVAKVIGYWAINKPDPIVTPPRLNDKMSRITNATREDISLEDFYTRQVEDGVRNLKNIFYFDVPEDYAPSPDDLELVLLELEEQLNAPKESNRVEEQKASDPFPQETASLNRRLQRNPEMEAVVEVFGQTQAEKVVSAPIAPAPRIQPVEEATPRQPAHTVQPLVERAPAQPREIVVTHQQEIEIPSTPPRTEMQSNVINISAEQTWQMIFGLMGFGSDYIQNKMLPRWKDSPDTFDKDRRFLYGVYLQAIRNATGNQYAAGNFLFSDQQVTVDQLWQHYFTDLAQNVGPLLTAAQLDADVNDPWWKRIRKWITERSKQISPVWILALGIAMIFDGLTTYVSLDQTPMEGFMVLVFTALITALFQIADVLVINYRQREFEAEALVAKFKAQYERLSKTITELSTISESYVQLSMERSQTHADWKAAEDNRRMAKRGRYWSARIADINIVVTAYGFAFMFLNASEPVLALVAQLDVIINQRWNELNLWVFIMIGLAVTVSFVINTAQRTEMLSSSMRRLKNEA